jgi:hypothetical protein
MPPNHRAMAVQSAKVRKANAARRRAVAAQHAADDARNHAEKLAQLADHLSTAAWPSGAPL